jgi:rSAM/selenodomain-associated transferase 2
MPASSVFCSIIIPVLNDAASLRKLLKLLQPLRQQCYEIIVVDGGSDEQLTGQDQLKLDRYLVTTAGRARQMNAGAEVARGELLWFVHADSEIDPKNIQLLLQQFKASGRNWGRFDVNLSGHDWRLKWVAFFMNWRSAITGIVTGDQGVFVYKKNFIQVNGYPNIAIMEDIALSKKLLKLSRPFRIRQRLTTSGRRWLTRGVFRTIMLMWSMRLAYFLGMSPQRLSRFYKPCTNSSAETSHE